MLKIPNDLTENCSNNNNNDNDHRRYIQSFSFHLYIYVCYLVNGSFVAISHEILGTRPLGGWIRHYCYFIIVLRTMHFAIWNHSNAIQLINQIEWNEYSGMRLALLHPHTIMPVNHSIWISFWMNWMKFEVDSLKSILSRRQCNLHRNSIIISINVRSTFMLCSVHIQQ